MEMSKFKSIVLGFWECGGLDVYVHPDPAFHKVILSAYVVYKWLVVRLGPTLALLVCCVACCIA